MAGRDVTANSANRAAQALNRLAKWRSVFAGWQLGTRPDTDPETQAVRDHREVTMLLRVEVSALVGLLMQKDVLNTEEYYQALQAEANQLNADLEERFPGFRATDIGMQVDKRAAETTKDWKP